MVCFRRSLELQPNYPEAHNNLGVALVKLGRYGEAHAAFRKALAIRPDYPDVYLNLGIALDLQDFLDEAAAAFQRAIELKPDFAKPHNSLGNAYRERGELDAALAAYRRGLELDPDQALVHSNLVFTLHFHPASDDAVIAAENRHWSKRFVEPLLSVVRLPANDRDPEKRLRIGYVSPDFRLHAITHFLVPLLEAHDHSAFEIFAYSSVRSPDAITARIEKAVDVWRDVHRLSDANLVERIREDRIDLLVDLSMHTANNRLLTFARQPAPVQVSWLAYPGNTGLATIEYRLTDARIEPAAPDNPQTAEQPWRLPDAWCCFAPIADFPAVSPLPAAENGYVTFASLNQFGKLNEELFSVWAQLLTRLPTSQLLMICPRGQAQERVRSIFASHGVAPERLALVAPCPLPRFMELFARIDIALDAYPCNGMTTTCHSLWMGVPVITRSGAMAVSRAAGSLLQTIGLGEWVAHGAEDYVRLAMEYAADLPRLARLRTTLRERMQTSPLMDAPRFARHMEVAYRAMWRLWCAQALGGE
jgi:predicted O-linked N-acetylglucosamine transferase (SPINDLY family)